MAASSVAGNPISLKNLSGAVPLMTLKLRGLTWPRQKGRQKLCKGFPISDAKFRRDPTSGSLAILEKKTHGGGVLESTLINPPPLARVKKELIMSSAILFIISSARCQREDWTGVPPAPPLTTAGQCHGLVYADDSRWGFSGRSVPDAAYPWVTAAPPSTAQQPVVRFRFRFVHTGSTTGWLFIGTRTKLKRAVHIYTNSESTKKHG